MEKYVVVVGFIIFDIITGIIKALAIEGLNSTILRMGLFHKLSEILSACGAGLAEYGAHYVNIGFDIPISTGVCAYICLMESISIIENICEINPGMAKFFKPVLNKLKTEQNATIPELPEKGESNGKEMGD